MFLTEEQRAAALERRELAKQILIRNYATDAVLGMRHAAIAADAVRMADALLAELDK